MLDQWYRNRLRRDLQYWVERGWLAPAGRESILVDLERSGPRVTPTIVFGALGAVLLAVGVLLFFAANWQAVPRWGKLTVIFGMVWSSYGAAWLLTRSGSRRFAEALVLLGILLFGSAILLIGQLYHLPADPPGGMLLWIFGTALAAWLWPSGLAAIAALVQSWFWLGLSLEQETWTVFWPYLPVWGLLLVPILRHHWWYARQAAVLSLFGWLLLTLGTAAEAYDAETGEVLRVIAGGAALLIACSAAGLRRPAIGDLAEGLLRIGLLFLAIPLVALPLPDAFSAPVPWGSAWGWFVAAAVPMLIGAGFALREPTGRARPATLLALGVAAGLLGLGLVPAPEREALLVLLGAPAAGMLWLVMITQGYRAELRFMVNLGFVGFAVAVLEVYFLYGWTLFDRALFFIAGGVLLIGLGWLLERQRRFLLARMEANP